MLGEPRRGEEGLERETRGQTPKEGSERMRAKWRKMREKGSFYRKGKKLQRKDVGRAPLHVNLCKLDLNKSEKLGMQAAELNHKQRQVNF